MRTAARFLPLAALLTFVAGLALRPMAESDLFFHLAAGQEILAPARAPRAQPLLLHLSRRAEHRHLLAVRGGRGGALRARRLPGRRLAKTVVLLVAFAGAYRICRRRGAGPVASALALAAAAFVGRDRFVERPHLFSLAGAVAALAAIDALGERAGAAAARAAAWFLAAVVALGQPARGRLRRAGAARRAAVAARRRGATGAGGAAARLCCAGGARGWRRWPRRSASGLVRYLRLHLTLPALHPVDEFRAPSWLSDAPLVVYAARWSARRVPLRGRRCARRGGARCVALAPVLPLALLALHSVRFGADLALVGGAAPGRGLDRRRRASGGALARALGGDPPLAAAGDRRRRAADRLRGRAAPRGRVGAARPSTSASTRASCRSRRSPSSTTTACAIGCTTTSRSGPTCCSSRARATRATGCSSIRACRPTRPRCTGCWAAPICTRDEWQAAMDRYGVDSALLAYAGINRRVAWWDPARWALVFRGGDARVFVRRLPRFSVAHRRPRDPRHLRVLRRGGGGDAAARGAPGCLAGRRLRVEPAARRPAVRARRRAQRAGARRLRTGARRAARLPGPRRRGAARRLAGGGRSGRGPRRPRARPLRAGARRRQPRALDLHRSRGGAGGARPPRRRRGRLGRRRRPRRRFAARRPRPRPRRPPQGLDRVPWNVAANWTLPGPVRRFTDQVATCGWVAGRPIRANWPTAARFFDERRRAGRRSRSRPVPSAFENAPRARRRAP